MPISTQAFSIRLLGTRWPSCFLTLALFGECGPLDSAIALPGSRTTYVNPA